MFATLLALPVFMLYFVFHDPYYKEHSTYDPNVKMHAMTDEEMEEYYGRGLVSLTWDTNPDSVQMQNLLNQVAAQVPLDILTANNNITPLVFANISVSGLDFSKGNSWIIWKDTNGNVINRTQMPDEIRSVVLSNVRLGSATSPTVGNFSIQNMSLQMTVTIQSH